MEPKEIGKGIFKIVNYERKKRRLKPLKPEQSLINTAISNAQNRKYCTVHHAMRKEKHWDIARKIVNSWIKDPNHKKHIFNKSYTHMGIGVYVVWDVNHKEYEIYVSKRFKQLKTHRHTTTAKQKQSYDLKKFFRKYKRLLNDKKVNKFFESVFVIIALFIVLYYIF